jgi:hypothetical protein
MVASISWIMMIIHEEGQILLADNDFDSRLGLGEKRHGDKSTAPNSLAAWRFREAGGYASMPREC